MKKTGIDQKFKSKWDAWPYQYIDWTEFNYNKLAYISYKFKPGKKKIKKSYNDLLIAIDTESSKTGINKKDQHGKWIPVRNIIVAWTLSVRSFDRNLVTLRGRSPADLIECIARIHKHLRGNKTIIYCHNLAYDYVFLRQFMFQKFGYPVSQLNTKPHYPIHIEFKNGIEFRDSLILAQRKLEKWAADLNVDHQKAMGFWDYNKLRTQSTELSTEELIYIENDTLALVECLDATRIQLNKRSYTLPYTATGIPREESRKIGEKNDAHGRFLSRALSADQQIRMEEIYHGGFTHANRHYINQLIDYDDIMCYDFASSYPYCMIAEKMPMERFTPYDHPMYIEDMLPIKDKYALTFTFIAKKIQLKDDFISMPYLQMSKCLHTVNAIPDNGRILCAEMVEIPLTEMDLAIIADQYEWESHVCIDVEYSRKDYLPKWFRDYVFKCFTDKTLLKGGDPVVYAIAKAKVNSLYGMMVQKPVKEDLQEIYETGEFLPKEQDYEKLYGKYVKRHKSILNYQWGVWVTAYAAYNLFQLGKCIDGMWLYSDTDSAYGTEWNKEKLQQYNDLVKERIRSAGYGPVFHNGREYWLGVAELDGVYSEFKTQGAKRYCVRDKESGQLKITVAGVPKKKGALCLHDDINNFVPGLIFDGTVTGKLTHYYMFTNNIEMDSDNNIFGDSIDLCPCDYLLDSVYTIRWEDFLTEEISIQIYEEN